MDWYERLADYFPEHELKHPGQMKELLEQTEEYRIRESKDYLVAYADFSDFIFIDYLLVDPKARGQGIGGKVLEMFKEKGKNIILEVEPIEASDNDTSRRIQFYERHGFKRANHIVYERETESGHLHSMDIYFWAPNPIHEREILQQMETICKDIHNFKSHKYYQRLVANPNDVLRWN